MGQTNKTPPAVGAGGAPLRCVVLVSVTVVVAVLFCVGRLIDHGRLAACAEHRRVQLVEQFRCAALSPNRTLG